MSYFLYSGNLTLGKSTTLSGDETRHILMSRRMKVGDRLEIQDLRGKRYEAKIQKIEKPTLELVAEKELEIPRELSRQITLLQAYINEKALDIIFQKATELGAAGITLYNSQNTATKLSAEIFKKKFERWEKILWEAAKQSGRGTIPTLKFLPDLNSVISSAENFEQFLILDASGVPLNLDQLFKSCSILIGPEGGFTSSELTQLKAIKNSQLASISPFTLRAETSAIAGLAIMVNK